MKQDIVNFQSCRGVPINGRPRGRRRRYLATDETLERINKALAKFNPEKIKMEDLAKTGGPAEEGE